VSSGFLGFVTPLDNKWIRDMEISHIDFVSERVKKTLETLETLVEEYSPLGIKQTSGISDRDLISCDTIRD
jgi:hypothetical protein